MKSTIHRALFSAIIATTFIFGSFERSPLEAQTSAGKIIVRLKMKELGIKRSELPRGLDIAGQSRAKGELDIVVNEDQYNELIAQGFELEKVDSQKPRVDSQYLRPEEITQFVAEIAETYPHIVKVKEIGRSHQGRPIYGVRISSEEGASHKPAILFNAMHHAREIMTPEIAIDIINYLTKNYEDPAKPEVQAWVDQLAIWVIPQLNPDGNAIVWESDNWWRKNAKGNDQDIWGVDLNRNYPYMWGSCRGSSGDQGNQTYRGESPASEPEVQAMLKFYKEQNFAMSISYHSYSEMVVAPYGCQDHYSPENFILKNIGSVLASKIIKDSGRGGYDYGTGWELLYPTDGEDISWMHHEVNSMAYVIEVNSSSQGFQPSYSKWRNSTVERQRAGWGFLLNRLLYGAQVRGQVVDSETHQPVDAEIRLRGVPYKDDKPRSAKGGFYQKLLAPGSFELEFRAAGYTTLVVPVSVDQSALELNVELEAISPFN